MISKEELKQLQNILDATRGFPCVGKHCKDCLLYVETTEKYSCIHVILTNRYDKAKQECETSYQEPTTDDATKTAIDAPIP